MTRIAKPLNPVRLAASGFVFTLLIAFLTSLISLHSMHSILEKSEFHVSDYALDLAELEKLRFTIEKSVSDARAFLLTGDLRYRGELYRDREEVASSLSVLSGRIRTPDCARSLRNIAITHKLYVEKQDQLIQAKQAGIRTKILVDDFERGVQPHRNALITSVDEFLGHKRGDVKVARAAAEYASSRLIRNFMVYSLLALLAGVATCAFLIWMLSALYGELATAIREREHVLAVVSHDLKSPLTAIASCSELIARVLSRDQRNGDLAARSLEIIRSSVGRMSAMISDLLDMAGAEAGTIRVRPRPVPLGELIRETLESFDRPAQEKRIRIEADVVNSQDRRETVHCDPVRFHQVLSNLIGNAVKFTPAGGRVLVRATPQLGQMLFEVSDTGPGIAEEDLPRIFDRFWQARETADLGSGLGLTIAKGIVEAHGGRIWVRSGLQQGCTFYFTLPSAEVS